MIKRIIGHDDKKTSDGDEHWLDLDGFAEVEVTSEETAHPIESALFTATADRIELGSCRAGISDCPYSV
jgi:hypothetical protein